MIRYEGFHSCSSSSSNMAEETNPPLRRMLKNRRKGKFSYAFKIPGKQCTFPQASKKHDEISLSVPGMQRSSLSPAPSSADIILDQPPSTGHPTFSPPKLQTISPNHVKPTFIGNENQCSITPSLSGHAQDKIGKKVWLFDTNFINEEDGSATLTEEANEDRLSCKFRIHQINIL